MSMEELTEWKTCQKKYILHIDGSSKINPWMGGGARILYNIDGIIEVRYVLDLGRKNKNQVELYGLLQGLNIAKYKGIKDIIILEDSLIIILYLSKPRNPNDNSLSQILTQIFFLANSFISKEYYHILIGNNLEVDFEDNYCSVFFSKMYEKNPIKIVDDK